MKTNVTYECRNTIMFRIPKPVRLPGSTSLEIPAYNSQIFSFHGKFGYVSFERLSITDAATSEENCSCGGWNASIFFSPNKQDFITDPTSSQYLLSGTLHHQFKLVDDTVFLSILVRSSVRYDMMRHTIKLLDIPHGSNLLAVELIIRWDENVENFQICNDIFNYQKRIGHELIAQLRQESHCDVVLTVKGQPIHAHRLILTAHSTVFKTMFVEDVNKKILSFRVKVEDLDPEGVKTMLEFMYDPTSMSTLLQSCSQAIETYKAAHKYQILILKRKCAFYIKNHLNEMNALDVMHISCVSGDAMLTDAAIQFILDCPNACDDTEKCLSLIEAFPELFQFLLRTCGVNKRRRTSYNSFIPIAGLPPIIRRIAYPTDPCTDPINFSI